MAEQYVPPLENERDFEYETPLQTDPNDELPSILHIDDYRDKRDERLLFSADLMRMGRAALLDPAAKDFTSFAPFYVRKEENGDVTQFFEVYKYGIDDDFSSMPHNGWSGGPENKTMINVHLNAASSEITSGLIPARNLIYVQEAIRAIESKENNTTDLELAKLAALDAEKEFRGDIARIAAAEAEREAAEINAQLAETRLNAANAEYETAQTKLKNI